MKLSNKMMKHMKKSGEMKGKCRKNVGKIWKNSWENDNFMDFNLVLEPK